MENLTPKEVDYAIAKERVKQMKKFYTSLALLILVFAIYAARKYYKTGEIAFLDFNNFSVIFWIWGFILALKAFKLYILNQSWERKMMNKELNK